MSDLEKSSTKARREQDVSVGEGVEIKKRFSFWTVFGITICTSGAWEGWSASIAQGLAGGGSVSLVWGWIFVSIGIIFMGLALAEFVSMWPSAGGQYVWVSHLAPQKVSRILGWFTAWASVGGLWLGAISCAMGAAVQLQAYIIISRPEYVPQTWHAYMFLVAYFFIYAAINIFHVNSLKYLNLSVLVIHIVGYILTLGVLLGTAEDKHDAEFVFTKFQSTTGWENPWISWSIGLLPALFAFFSLDSASHFCEEVDRPKVLVPRAMVLQVFSSALMTLPIIIATLFCIGDIDGVLLSPIGQTSPFTQIVLNSTGSVPAAIIINGVSSWVAWVAGCDLWGAAARSIWSMARDKGLPHWLARLSPKLDIPVWANLVLLLPTFLTSLIYIWNTTAFYGLMAGVLVAFQLSYVIPIAVYVWTSMKGEGTALKKGPFDLGRWSLPVHIVSLAFGIYMIIFLSFPVYVPVTAENMNYSSALIGAILLFSLVSWFAYARSRYTVAIEYFDDDGRRHVQTAVVVDHATAQRMT